MNQLMEYIRALTNLYGLVHKNKVIEIYNQQYDEKASMQQVDALLANPPRELDEAFIGIHEDYFVHEAILESGEFAAMLEKQVGKAHYVPD